ncbi:tRNA1(Val) (adenine(37)-N6)-methyltransferase [Tuberibacillus sp. Marseille-P3662]|uniref:tRNA1(Val) (adenine(37)-N6)-methyltransferase n=1 Tax=Tuberibacillus sp. Marseille-P3662 TaxID=1965358 RepID=UPI000A1CEEFC|nr:tRNA1(Val) (adenine(37)-N6)-methyltransferase [Tuberibacillus sp. Marseille-P3662]
MVQLEADERVDYLFNSPMKIIQSDDIFSFSLDAVLLSKFVYVPIKRGHILDLCTGNGAIALLLTERTNAQITGIEIQERLQSMAERSIKMNQLEHQVNSIHADVNDAVKQLIPHSYDIVTCNPPYFPYKADSDRNTKRHLELARHEVAVTLEEIVSISSQLVKGKGKVAFVHRPERLLDIMSVMRREGIEPKRLQFIYPKQGKQANIMLIEGIKDGNPGLNLLPPLFVYNEQGQYTKELLNYRYEK